MSPTTDYPPSDRETVDLARQAAREGRGSTIDEMLDADEVTPKTVTLDLRYEEDLTGDVRIVQHVDEDLPPDTATPMEADVTYEATPANLADILGQEMDDAGSRLCTTCDHYCTCVNIGGLVGASWVTTDCSDYTRRDPDPITTCIKAGADMEVELTAAKASLQLADHEVTQLRGRLAVLKNRSVRWEEAYEAERAACKKAQGQLQWAITLSIWVGIIIGWMTLGAVVYFCG